MTPLTIAVDARELAGHPTGVGRYLLELVQRWTVRPDARSRRLMLYSHAALACDVPHVDDVRVMPGAGETLWEQTTLARAVRQDAPDVLFAPAYTAPLAIDVPVVLTIHDLSFEAHPEWFTWREGVRRRLLTRLSARKAAVVLTVSRFSAAEIGERLGVPRERVRVVYHGIDRRPQRPTAPHDGAQPLVLYVGSLFSRRRIGDLLDAFARVVESIPDARLTVVGDNRTVPREDPRAMAEALGVGDRVSVASYLPDPALADLYSRASAFVFVSDYEGFGLTPLEALAAGVPIVVADTPISHEIYGEAALFVPPGEVPALAAAIRRLLADETARASALAPAAAVLARYSWDRAAGETLAAIEDAARPGDQRR